MNIPNWAELSTRKLCEWLVELCVRQHVAAKRLDTATYNQIHDWIYGITQDLLARGDEGRAVFRSLLVHEDANVRLKSAAACLRFAPDLGIPVLENLDRGEDLEIGAMAGVALQMWREGDFPPKK